MRILAFLSVLITPLSLVAQIAPAPTGVTTATTAPQRDTAALSAIGPMATAYGWQKLAQPSDVLILGTVTRHFPDSSNTADFTIRLRGTSQYSYEEGGFKAVTNGAAGAVIAPTGKTVRISGHSALAMVGMIFPGLSAISDWQSSDVELTTVGPKAATGVDCIVYRLQKHYSDSDPAAKSKQIVAPIELWVSKADGSLFRADYIRVAENNHYATFKETVYFSDYRRINGVAVPFRQEIYLGDDHIKTVQLNTVTFNTGLTDADFDVKGVLGGAR